MEPFEGLDFYDVDSLLTEEEIMIRDMVREWVDESVIPRSNRLARRVCSSTNGESHWERWVSSAHRSKGTVAPDFPTLPTA